MIPAAFQYVRATSLRDALKQLSQEDGTRCSPAGTASSR
jgi:hypothetical protein